MRFSRDEGKRRLELKEHGSGFVDAPGDPFWKGEATRSEEAILFKNLQGR